MPISVSSTTSSTSTTTSSNSLLPIREYALSVNNFNEPEVFERAKALMLLLTRLILLEPGTFQSHPDMGVGLLSRYRYTLDDGTLANSLKSRILTQIDTYLPILSGVTVNVRIVEKCFFINIQIDTIIFGILYDVEANSIQTDYTTIAEL